MTHVTVWLVSGAHSQHNSPCKKEVIFQLPGFPATIFPSLHGFFLDFLRLLVATITSMEFLKSNLAITSLAATSSVVQFHWWDKRRRRRRWSWIIYGKAPKSFFFFFPTSICYAWLTRNFFDQNPSSTSNPA